MKEVKHIKDAEAKVIKFTLNNYVGYIQAQTDNNKRDGNVKGKR